MRKGKKGREEEGWTRKKQKKAERQEGRTGRVYWFESEMSPIHSPI